MTPPAASLDALPPNARDSEQALLGAILHHNAAIDRARDFVQPDDFFDPVHQQVFAAMIARRDAGEAIDLGLMKAVFGNADLGGVTVIVGAPDPGERILWRDRLGGELVTLAVPLEECLRRIQADPAREGHRDRMIRSARAWWEKNLVAP